MKTTAAQQLAQNRDAEKKARALYVTKCKLFQLIAYGISKRDADEIVSLARNTLEVISTVLDQARFGAKEGQGKPPWQVAESLGCERALTGENIPCQEWGWWYEPGCLLPAGVEIPKKHFYLDPLGWAFKPRGWSES